MLIEAHKHRFFCFNIAKKCLCLRTMDTNFNTIKIFYLKESQNNVTKHQRGCIIFEQVKHIKARIQKKKFT